VASLLAEADAGVVTFAPFPVLEANSANKYYDYLASGLPVVITYQGWQARYLREWECGLSSEMKDLQTFADNFIHLLNNPQLRRQMGENGRKLAAEKFDRSKLAAELLEEFVRILSTK
jgi:glycosyltransferase involved in cell wall biosynthesis